jgi:hypothetical protein
VNATTMRPDKGLGGWLMRRMPPVTHEDLGPLPALKPRGRQQRKALVPHMVWLLPALTAVILLEPSQYSLGMQVLGCLSVVGIIPTTGALVTGSYWPLTAQMYITLVVIAFGLLWIVRHPKQYSQGVRDEERWCREGAEHWSVSERARACAIFGLMHVRLLVVPLALGVVTGVMGAVFMHEYLRAYRENDGSRQAALQASQTLHMTTNSQGPILLVSFIVVSTLISAFKTFG